MSHSLLDAWLTGYRDGFRSGTNRPVSSPNPYPLGTIGWNYWNDGFRASLAERRYHFETSEAVRAAEMDEKITSILAAPTGQAA